MQAGKDPRGQDPQERLLRDRGRDVLEVDDALVDAPGPQRRLVQGAGLVGRHAGRRGSARPRRRPAR